MGQNVDIELGGVRLGGNTSAGKRAGQFLFLGGITPHDLSSGRLVTSLSQLPPEALRARIGRMSSDIPEERAVAQAWSIYSTLSQMLAQNGSSLDLLLRQRLLLTDLRDLPAVERVMDVFLPKAKPATTIVQVPTRGTHPLMSLQIDCIALMPQPGGITKETISAPGLEMINGRYPQATRAGQFVFVSNITGINPQTGKLAVSLAELGAKARRFAAHRFYSAKEEAVLAQAWFTFQNISQVLASQGASLADILKVNGWLVISMREFDPVRRVREGLFVKREAKPASCSIVISNLVQESALLGYDCTALVPPGRGAGHRKEVRSEIATLTPMYALSVRGGPLVFTCGEVAIDVKTPKVIKGFEDLDNEGRFLPFGRMHADTPIQAQAWFVYKQLGSYLADHRASFSDVVHQTVFICNPADYPALERVATLFFGSKVPATSVIPITETSPYAEAMFEIEMIAAT